MSWQPIETAPKDGSWFMICCAEEGFDSYEVGKYDPLHLYRYMKAPELGDNIYRYVKNDEPSYEWRGFNNLHRATHWMPLPSPPSPPNSEDAG